MNFSSLPIWYSSLHSQGETNILLAHSLCARVFTDNCDQLLNQQFNQYNLGISLISQYIINSGSSFIYLIFGKLLFIRTFIFLVIRFSIYLVLWFLLIRLSGTGLMSLSHRWSSRKQIKPYAAANNRKYFIKNNKIIYKKAFSRAA